MSELINTHDNRATIRWKLLTGASALALTAYVSSAGLAKAEDTSRPQIWIELGGELQQIHGLGSSFTAPFMTAISPTPGPYSDNIFTSGQRPPRFALGFDGEITFQPEDSDWVFSAGIRYGRSHTNRHIHHQTVQPPDPYVSYRGYVHYLQVYLSPFADIKSPRQEKHAILDFSAGKDLGLGMFGHDGTSTLSLGVRFAQFTSNSSIHATGRPSITPRFPNYPSLATFFNYGPFFAFHQYAISGHAARSFKGVGPSLSWEGSAAIAGNMQDGELTLDFGINGAELFGRQKAKTDHATSAYSKTAYRAGGARDYNFLYSRNSDPSHNHHSTRSKSVSVPNIGGSIGISFRYPNFKFSLGYRYDTFLNAMDTGIDARKTSNLTFHGPYASISIGLGD